MRRRARHGVPPRPSFTTWTRWFALFTSAADRPCRNFVSTYAPLHQMCMRRRRRRRREFNQDLERQTNSLSRGAEQAALRVGRGGPRPSRTAPPRRELPLLSGSLMICSIFKAAPPLPVPSLHLSLRSPSLFGLSLWPLLPHLQLQIIRVIAGIIASVISRLLGLSEYRWRARTHSGRARTARRNPSHPVAIPGSARAHTWGEGADSG